MARNKRDSIGNDLGLKNVLVARFSALGDVAMTIPVVYSACAAYPDVRFVLVTRPSMTGIFLNSPSNLIVVGADVNSEYNGINGIRRLVDELVDRYSIDAFVDLHDVLRTKLMRLFCRMKGLKVSKLNKGRAHKRALTRRYNKVMLPLTSSRARYREAFFRIGLPVEDSFTGLYGRGGSGDMDIISHIAGPAKPEDEKWIGIAPFAAHAGKIYPPEKMLEVIDILVTRLACRIFVFGGGGREKDIAGSWEEKHAQVTSLCGKRYGFPAELSLLSHLDVMLTMDSANMHLASIVGVPTISIWGATHPYCGFKGWHQSDADMVQLPLTCRPCSVFGDKPCFRHDMLCMQAIRPETIVKKLTEKLQAAGDK